jgi:cell wall-associated NlpC family hydrolase
VKHAATRLAGLTRALAALGSPCAVGSCLHFVRTCYSAPGGVHDAALWWAHAPHRHPGDLHAPAGAPVAWTGGRDGFGHVGISDGMGNIIGTDFPKSGHIGRVPISHVGGGSLHFAGWAEPDFGPGT